MNSTVLTILATIGISLISLIGGILLVRTRDAHSAFIPLLVSFAAGVMLGATFFDILPEAFGEGTIQLVLSSCLGGIVFSFIIEHFVLWFHHHHEDVHNLKPPVYLVLIGDALHNFIDGIAVSASFMINPVVGISTAIAIAAHEIPQELADFSVLLHAGMNRTRALMMNFFSALTAVAGAIVGLYFLSQFEMLLPFVLGFTAGMFIYIACADLIPELHIDVKKRLGLLQMLIFSMGIALMFIITKYAPDPNFSMFPIE